MPPPNHKRTAQIAITTRQKLRPLLLLDAKPKAAPIPAINSTGHSSNPNNGMKPMNAMTSAMRPKMNAMILAMSVSCALFLGHTRLVPNAAEILRQTKRQSPLNNPAVARGPIFVAQQPFVELTCSMAGKLFAEIDLARHFDARQV